MIQWLTKSPRGHPDRHRFRTAIYFHLGGLDLYPDSFTFHTKPSSNAAHFHPSSGAVFTAAIRLLGRAGSQLWL